MQMSAYEVGLTSRAGKQQACPFSTDSSITRVQQAVGIIRKLPCENSLFVRHHRYRYNSIMECLFKTGCGLTMYLNRKNLSLAKNKLLVAK